MNSNNINLHTASATDVAAWVADATHPGRDERTKNRRYDLRKGVKFILGQIADLPGATWQEKWLAAGEEHEAYYLAEMRYHSPGDPNLNPKIRLLLPQSFKALLRYGILRPSLYLILNPGVARSMLPGVEAAHESDIQRLVDGATAVSQLTVQTLGRVRLAAAAMIVYTGRPLSDIGVDEWVAAERLRRQSEVDYKQWRKAVEATPDGQPIPPQPFRARPWSQTLSLTAAYAGARRSGLLQPRPAEPGSNPLPPTLDGALRPAVNLTNILATYGRDLPPRVRNLTYDVYTIDGGSLDFSTLKTHIGDLNTYFRSIHQVAPGHDSLHLPMNIREAVFNALSRTNSKYPGGPTEERQAVGHLLGRIRTTYRMANSVVQRAELTQHLETLGTFPWSDATIQRIVKKERARRRSRFHSKVNVQLPHLDGLVTASYDLMERTDRIRDEARRTPQGGSFVVDGVEYLRPAGKGPQQGSGVPVLTIRLADGPAMSWFDIEARAYTVAQACTLTVLLRESGLRIEEVSELEVENVASILAGDQSIPAITVNPGKVDRERIVGLTPEALRALHALIVRTRERFGESPMVVRADWHEGTDGPPARLIFQIVSRRTHVGPGHQFFVGLLNRVVDHYNEHFNPAVPLASVGPHQMRRLFASDLGRRGVDILALASILGHSQTHSTDTYLHMDEAEALAMVIAARNRKNAIANGLGCACCDGQGFHERPGDCASAGQAEDEDGQEAGE